MCVGVLLLVVSHEHFGKRIGAGACNVGLRRMESNAVDRFIELLAMARDLLDASFVIQMP